MKRPAPANIAIPRPVAIKCIEALNIAALAFYNNDQLAHGDIYRELADKLSGGAKYHAQRLKTRREMARNLLTEATRGEKS